MLSKRLFSCGRFKLPPIKGEVFLDYAPGSAERAALKVELNRVRNEVVEIPCVINGIEYYSGDTFYQTMPQDHSHKIAKVHRATPALIQEAIKVSQEARIEWARMPFEHRATILKKAGDLNAGKHRARIVATTMLGTGKTAWQGEIDAAVEGTDFLRMNPVYAQEIYDVQPGLNSPNTWNRMEYRELEGFVMAISPFNFCAIGINLATAPALMGNTCLWKPASTSALSNYTSFQMLQESGMPPGVISFLPSDPEVAGEAINHPQFAGLHFTGSTKTFNHLWKQIGNNLDNYTGYPRIVGETGGKNFHLMHPSADIDHCVMNTVRGAFEYQGQKCSATSRFYVPKSKWAEVKEKMLAAHAEIKVGNVDDFSVYVSAVIDGAAFKKHKLYLDEAHAAPECEIIAGGKYDDSVGYFIDPTIIVTSDPHYKTMKEEIFGPVLTVFVYDDSKPEYWKDVMKLIDTTTPYGLTGSIFANDRIALASGSDGLRHSSGMLYLNDKSTGAVVGEQPFGGARKSGTNDKAGSHLNLLRWCSARTIKETTGYINDFKYPYMNSE